MNPSIVNPSHRRKPINTNAAGRYDWMKISLARDGAVPAVQIKLVSQFIINVVCAYHKQYKCCRMLLF